MGAFDQFKDQATQYEEQAKGAVGNKRDKSANPQQQERMERERGQRDGQQRGSEFEDRARERMDRDAEEEQDWA